MDHTWSISHHITPLIIYALGGGHTHILTHEPKHFQETRHASASGWCTPGLKITSSHIVSLVIVYSLTAVFTMYILLILSVVTKGVPYIFSSMTICAQRCDDEALINKIS